MVAVAERVFLNVRSFFLRSDLQGYMPCHFPAQTIRVRIVCAQAKYYGTFMLQCVKTLSSGAKQQQH